MSESNETPSLPAQMTGSGVGALSGLAIGGPVGALVGGLSTPLLIEMAQKAWEELSSRRRDNVISIVAQASGRLGVEADDLLRNANSTQEGTALLADAIQAAIETLDDRKVAGLAKAVANGLHDDQAEVEENLLLVRAIADLEAAHVRLLGSLPTVGRGRSMTATNLAMVAVLQRNGLATDDAHRRAIEVADERADEIEKVLLEIKKLLDGKKGKIPSRLKRPSGTRASRTRPRWTRTPFGTQCLEHLYEAAKEVDLVPMDDLPVDEEDEATAEDVESADPSA